MTRTPGFWLTLALGACATTPTTTAPTPAPRDVLVWQASPPATVWFRDGSEVARRNDVIVVARGELWVIGYRVRTATSTGSCEDGCSDCGAERAPVATHEVPIDELVATPLGGGAARFLATQTTQEDVSCGVGGRRPELRGGMDARLSVVWAQGDTTSAAVGEEGGPTGAVFDLGGGDPVPRVTLTAPPDFVAEMHARLAPPCAPDDDVCVDRLDDAAIVGPVALLMGPITAGGDPPVEVRGLACRDAWGLDADDTAEIEVTTEALGLGPLAPDAIAAAVAAFGSPWVWGYSHAPGTEAERNALLQRFRAP